METKNFNELMDLVPSHVITEFNLTQNQTIVLGQLIMLNGLDYQKDNGYFYRSNKDLAEDCGVTTTGLLKILNKLINCKLIERKTGNRKDGASLYKINTNIFENNTNKIENIMKEQVTYQVTQKLPNELPIKIIDYLSVSLQVIDKLLNSYLTQLPNEVTHQVTSDTESDIDKDIDIYNNINNKINNIKETINNNLNKINNNILNISESVVTTENELTSTEFKNEVEDNEEKINEYQVEEEIDVEPVTVEEEIEDNLNSVQGETVEHMDKEDVNRFVYEKIEDYTNNDTKAEDLDQVRDKINEDLRGLLTNGIITSELYNFGYAFVLLPTINHLYSELLDSDMDNLLIEDDVEIVSVIPTKHFKENTLPAEETATPTAKPSSNIEEKFKLALDNFNNDGSRGQEAMDRRSIALKKLYDAKQDGSISEPFYKDCISQLCVICSNKGL